LVTLTHVVYWFGRLSVHSAAELGVSAFTFDAGVKVQAFAITADEGGGVVRTTHLPVVEAAVKQD